MGRRKRDKLEFRFYEVPPGECALALLGEAWVGVYGRSDVCLHFHNLFEIGYCHYGRGRLLLSLHSHETINGRTVRRPHFFLLDDEGDRLQLIAHFKP